LILESKVEVTAGNQPKKNRVNTIPSLISQKLGHIRRSGDILIMFSGQKVKGHSSQWQPI